MTSVDRFARLETRIWYRFGKKIEIYASADIMQTIRWHSLFCYEVGEELPCTGTTVKDLMENSSDMDKCVLPDKYVH